jgi:hypothetical protein
LCGVTAPSAGTTTHPQQVLCNILVEALQKAACSQSYPVCRLLSGENVGRVAAATAAAAAAVWFELATGYLDLI